MIHPVTERFYDWGRRHFTITSLRLIFRDTPYQLRRKRASMHLFPSSAWRIMKGDSVSAVLVRGYLFGPVGVVYHQPDAALQDLLTAYEVEDRTRHYHNLCRLGGPNK